MIFATASLFHAYLMCLDQESWDGQILFEVEMYLENCLKERIIATYILLLQ